MFSYSMAKDIKDMVYTKKKVSQIQTPEMEPLMSPRMKEIIRRNSEEKIVLLIKTIL